MTATPQPQDTDLQNEHVEALRAANLISAALRDAFYYVVDSEDSGDYTIDDVFKPLKFRKLSGPQAEMIVQHTGWQTVFVAAEAPLLAWIPTRMTFQIRPTFLREWKEIILKTWAATEEALRLELAEMKAEEAAEAAEEVDEIQAASSPIDTPSEAVEDF